MKILITDCLNRKAYDIYNIVRLHYESSDIILASDSLSRLKCKLVYNKLQFVLRKSSINHFVEDLLFISNTFSDESIIYLPVEEDTTILFYSFLNRVGPLNILYCLPKEDCFNLARDKYLLNKYCLKKEIPAPTLFEDGQLNNLPKKDFVPLIVKPRWGSGAKGIKVIENFTQLSILDELDYHDYVIQEKLNDGKSVKGAFFLCKQGVVISSYCHERIRTFPISGGVSTYSKISINTEIIVIGSRLLSMLNWSGLVMIEFLWDQKQNTYKIIEINPRLWGSILLSEISGKNFLLKYIELCMNQPISESNINYNAKIRWLPFDFLNFISSKGKIKKFWNLDKKNTCYINCTYATWRSLFWFHVFFYFSLTNFKILIKKWKK
jgi:hypothetical protein